jgi:hypothetical protein
MFTEVEPFYGWLHLYAAHRDPHSPFYNEAAIDPDKDMRYIYTFEAHPLWDHIHSESLLVKMLYADYNRGFCILQLLGEWNDLFENDFKLLYEQVLAPMLYQGVSRFIFLCENVFNVYLDQDDYYELLQEALEDTGGWLCLLRARQHVLNEFAAYGIDQYLYWNPEFDELRWRKMKPWQLYELIERSLQQFLPQARSWGR